LPKKNVPFTVEEKGAWADHLTHKGSDGGKNEGRANRCIADLPVFSRVRYTLALAGAESRIWRRGCKIGVVNEWPYVYHHSFIPGSQFAA
jgi:hypothetical protein